MPRPPERGGEITDEMTALWRKGCALLDQMAKRECGKGESDRYCEFMAIDKKLTWRLVGPRGKSLFSAISTGPPGPWVSPEHLQYIDWAAAQTWRRSPIEAAGTPKDRRMENHFL